MKRRLRMIEEGKNLIVTYEQEGAFDSQIVAQIIDNTFDL